MKLMYKNKQISGGSGGMTEDKVTQAINTAITASETKTANTYLKLVGGTMSGIVDMGSNKITGIAEPTDNTDAVNKQYLQTSIDNLTTLISNTYVSKSEPAASGPLNMNSNKISSLAAPTADTDAATKKYVDDLVTNSINESITQALGGSY